MTEICDWSDLQKEQCGHCQGHCDPLNERPGNWDKICGFGS